MELFVVTTHYPYGTWQESFFATELQVLSESFKRVTLLPLKELKGRRSIPDNVEILPPLVGKRRWDFFLRRMALPRTWGFLFSALRDALAEGKFELRVLPNCLKFACYRSGIAADPHFREFVSQSEGRIVYGYWAHFPALAALEAHTHAIPTCVRYHSGDLYEEQLPFCGHFMPWRNELRRKIDLQIFVSKHGEAYFRGSSHRPPPRRTEVLPLGSPDFGTPRPRKPPELTNLVMASVSFLVPNKRVHLIASLAQALATHANVVWHHFGTGKDPALDRVLSRHVDRLTVVMHGDTPNSVIQNFFRSTDITFFANMSLSEGVPVSLMEALNADIPVIATEVGGTPELILNGRSGFTMSCDECLDSDRLARRVKKELEPGGLLAISRPREVWEERWNARTNSIKLAEALRSTMLQPTSNPI